MNDFVFDPKKDYFKELTDDELWDGKYPLLRGLQRLAHERGIRQIESKIICVPSKESPIAAVTVLVAFKDGTVFAGSADASYKAHEAPFNKHLTALADSKAEARAYRRAFNISTASKEECGETPAGGEIDKTPIVDAQIQGIKNMSNDKKITVVEAVGLIGVDKNIEELTGKQARDVIRALNKYKPKKTVAKRKTAEATK